MKEFFQRLENGYLLRDIVFFGGLFWTSQTTEEFEVCLSLIILFASIILWITVFHLGTKVINNSHEDVWAKGEDGAVVYRVPAGGFKNHVNGLKVNGRVYKLPDGARAIVTKNGHIIFLSIIGHFLYKLGCGELRKAPDPTWMPLFDSPQTEQKQCSSSSKFEELYTDPIHMASMMPEISLKCPIKILPTKNCDGYVIKDASGHEYFFYHTEEQPNS